MQSDVLTSISSKQRSAISGRPNKRTLGYSFREIVKAENQKERTRPKRPNSAA